MNAKEYLQLNKQIELFLAFSSVMKGELAKETKQAKDALAELQEAKDIVKAKEDLALEKDRFEEYRKVRDDAFESAVRKLKDKEKFLSEKENDLHVRGVEMDSKTSQFAAFAAKAKQSQDEVEQNIVKAQIKLAQVELEIENKRKELQQDIDKVVAREEAVAAKLKAIKALA